MTRFATAYLNGEFLPLTEARVSVMDRGFLFGDAVYEVIPVYGGAPFRLYEHLRRLESSLAAIRLPNPLSQAQWAHVVEELIQRQPEIDQQIYLQVTRGTDGRRNHAFPQVVRPTRFALSEPLLLPPEEHYREGVRAISAADIRWQRCDIKSTSLIANCLLRQRALDAGCAEVILLRDGFLTEGSAANIFVVRNDQLLAPPKNHLMLPGITYDVILELAAQLQLNFCVRDILEEEVHAADELWLSSSTREVLAIVELDGRRIGQGQPGPRYRQMLAAYQDYKRKVMRQGVA